MGMLDRRKLAFDSILARKSSDAYNEMPLDTFMAMPIDERISMIMEKRIRFFADEVEVPTYVAIKSLDDARGDRD